MSSYYFNNIKDLPFSNYDIRDKALAVRYKCRYMLDRTQSMFKYTGLPETIPARMLELYLQINGFAGFYEHKENLYVFFGGLGGEPDEYYRPTMLTISNPALNLSVNAIIGRDTEIVINDSLLMGLMPLNTMYASLLAENELSMHLAIVNSRIIDLISASDERTKLSAEKFLKDVEEGKLGVIAETAFLEALKTMPYGASAYTGRLKELIEFQQYNRASWYNDLGLDANFNMKRETLNEAETAMNGDSLIPLIDDMLECRKIGLDKVNKMFGTNITVDLSSSWRNRKEMLEEAQEMEQGQEGAEDGEENFN